MSKQHRSIVNIVFTGGGSGGHVFPVVAVLRELKRQFRLNQIEYRFVFIGAKDDFSSVYFANEQIPARFISAGKIRRYFSLRNILDMGKVPVGILQSLWHLWILMPHAIFSKGGFGSFPVVFAAWLYRIPVLLHESDAVPGLANKILAKFSKRIVTSFPNTPGLSLKKSVLIGNPIRNELLYGSNEQLPDPIPIIEGRKTIFVMGGSQGSQRINDFLLQVLPKGSVPESRKTVRRSRRYDVV